MLSKAEAEALLAEEKLITANIRWQPLKSKSGRRYRFEVVVLVPSRNVALKLHGQVAKTNRSFVLIFGGDPIRKYTVHAKHRNPDGTVIREPHKHLWDEVNEDGYAYIPKDITPGDPNREFVDFLKQCNIRLLGSYTPFLL